MVAEGGAGGQPEGEDTPEALRTEGVVAGVNEADDGDVLVVEGPEEFLRHRGDGGERTVAAIAAAREVVDGDGDLTIGRAGGEGESEKDGGSQDYRIVRADDQII